MYVGFKGIRWENPILQSKQRPISFGEQVQDEIEYCSFSVYVRATLASSGD